VSALSLEPDPAAGLSAKRARKLLDAVLGRAGSADGPRRLTALRRGAAATGAVPDPGADELGAAAGLVDKVAHHAYRITEDDVAALKSAGFSEAEVFDLIVSTAIGAGMARRAIGLDAVERWQARR
jgi:alkylhydroperoxidase family enzyme